MTNLARKERVDAAMRDAAPTVTDPPIDTSLPPPRKRRSPDEQHRERLTARIAKLKTQRATAVSNAQNDAMVRVNARFASRLIPLERMLAAITEAAE